jgi:CDP-diglyceride synthetase
VVRVKATWAVWGFALACFALGALFIGWSERHRGTRDSHMRASWLQGLFIVAAVLGPATAEGWVAAAGTTVLGILATTDVLRCAAARGRIAVFRVPALLWLICFAWMATRLPTLGSTFGTIAFLFGVLELSDSAAYLAGRTFGRRKLAPVLSPGKTWEGVLAGLLVAGLSGAALSICLESGPGTGALLGLALAPAGVVADLAISAVKRSLGVKDFAHYLPASGSIADALDSYLLLLPLWVAARAAI